MIEQNISTSALTPAERLQSDIVTAVLQYRADQLAEEEISHLWYVTLKGPEKDRLYGELQRLKAIREGSLARIELLADRLNGVTL